MDIPVLDLKSKWNTLRIQELHERAKEEKSKSGMGVTKSINQFGNLCVSKMRFVGQCKKQRKVRRS